MCSLEGEGKKVVSREEKSFVKQILQEGARINAIPLSEYHRSILVMKLLAVSGIQSHDHLLGWWPPFAFFSPIFQCSVIVCLPFLMSNPWDKQTINVYNVVTNIQQKPQSFNSTLDFIYHLLSAQRFHPHLLAS